MTRFGTVAVATDGLGREWPDKTRCAGECQSRDGWHFYQCHNKAKFEEHGFKWCGMHLPSRVAERHAKREAAYQAKRAEERRISERRDALAALRKQIVDEAVALSRQSGDYDKLMELAAQYEAVKNEGTDR